MMYMFILNQFNSSYFDLKRCEVTPDGKHHITALPLTTSQNHYMAMLRRMVKHSVAELILSINFCTDVECDLQLTSASPRFPSTKIPHRKPADSSGISII